MNNNIQLKKNIDEQYHITDKTKIDEHQHTTEKKRLTNNNI